MRLFRHPWWQHLDYRVKVATTQENKPPTQGTRQWTFTTPRWRCGSILLPSLNAGVPEPTGGDFSWSQLDDDVSSDRLIQQKLQNNRLQRDCYENLIFSIVPRWRKLANRRATTTIITTTTNSTSTTTTIAATTTLSSWQIVCNTV